MTEKKSKKWVSSKVFFKRKIKAVGGVIIIIFSIAFLPLLIECLLREDYGGYWYGSILILIGVYFFMSIWALYQLSRSKQYDYFYECTWCRSAHAVVIMKVIMRFLTKLNYEYRYSHSLKLEYTMAKGFLERLYLTDYPINITHWQPFLDQYFPGYF